MTTSGKSHGTGGIMTFYPTIEEFQDMKGLVRRIEEEGAHKMGIAKIIPPREWKPRAKPLTHGLKNIGNMQIMAPILQKVVGSSIHGVYQVSNSGQRNMTVRKYAEQALERQVGFNYEDIDGLERSYWRTLNSTEPGLYGADVSGTITDPAVETWNCAKLPSILDHLKADYGSKIEGVNTPYLYFGMWKTTFAIHTEDMDLYSVNYNHYGAPKFWYALPPAFARKFEAHVSEQNFQNFQECKAYLRHKNLLYAQSWFDAFDLPVNKIAQHEGEMIITFPMGYHWGFNMGLNVAESTNFATERWIEYGKRCTRCVCEPDRVNISMEAFVRHYQPDKYKNWLIGKDLGRHPEAPETEEPTFAPAPTLVDLLAPTRPPPECRSRIAELKHLETGTDGKLRRRGSSRAMSGAKRAVTSKRQASATPYRPRAKKLRNESGEAVGSDGKSPDSIPECLVETYECANGNVLDSSSDEEFVCGPDGQRNSAAKKKPKIRRRRLTLSSSDEEAEGEVGNDCVGDRPAPSHDLKPETTPDVKPEPSHDVKPETTPDVKPETSHDVKPETSPDVKLETGHDVEPEIFHEVKPKEENHEEMKIIDKTVRSIPETNGNILTGPSGKEVSVMPAKKVLPIVLNGAKKGKGTPSYCAPKKPQKDAAPRVAKKREKKICPIPKAEVPSQISEEDQFSEKLPFRELVKKNKVKKERGKAKKKEVIEAKPVPLVLPHHRIQAKLGNGSVGSAQNGTHSVAPGSSAKNDERFGKIVSKDVKPAFVGEGITFGGVKKEHGASYKESHAHGTGGHKVVGPGTRDDAVQRAGLSGRGHSKEGVNRSQNGSQHAVGNKPVQKGRLPHVQEEPVKDLTYFDALTNGRIPVSAPGPSGLSLKTAVKKLGTPIPKTPIKVEASLAGPRKNYVNPLDELMPLK